MYKEPPNKSSCNVSVADNLVIQKQSDNRHHGTILKDHMNNIATKEDFIFIGIKIMLTLPRLINLFKTLKFNLYKPGSGGG